MKTILLLLIIQLFNALDMMPLSLASFKFTDTIFPKTKHIEINGAIIYPQSLKEKKAPCFSNNFIEVKEGDSIIILANTNFIAVMTTISSSLNYKIDHNYGRHQQIRVNSMINALQVQNGFQVRIPIGLICKETDTHAYYRIKASLQLNFYEQDRNEQHELSLLMLCSTDQAMKEFNFFFIPGYVMFWMIVNLSLQIYHNYRRNNQYLTLFSIYLFASGYITNEVLAYIFLGFSLLLILLMEKKVNRISAKTFGVYLFFVFILVSQVLLTFYEAKTSQKFSGIWIILDNFLVIHVSMFICLRLIKLTRFREVFWYFVAISIFSLLMQGSHNRFFTMQFKNLLNLRCLKVNLFFPVMMLPISNFYSTIQGYLHRPFAILILFVSVMDLRNGIKWAGIVCLLGLIMLIKMKNIKVIQHKSQ